MQQESEWLEQVGTTKLAALLWNYLQNLQDSRKFMRFILVQHPHSSDCLGEMSAMFACTLCGRSQKRARCETCSSAFSWVSSAETAALQLPRRWYSEFLWFPRFCCRDERLGFHVQPCAFWAGRRGQLGTIWRNYILFGWLNSHSTSTIWNSFSELLTASCLNPHFKAGRHLGCLRVGYLKQIDGFIIIPHFDLPYVLNYSCSDRELHFNYLDGSITIQSKCLFVKSSYNPCVKQNCLPLVIGQIHVFIMKSLWGSIKS